MTTTKTSAPRRGRRLIAGLSSLALPFILSGCFVFSPMATETMYNPGDGVNVDLGEVQVRDMLVIGSAEDAPATLVAYVVNHSSEPVTVDFTGSGGTASVEVEPNSSTQVSPPGEGGSSFDSLGAAPGAMVPIQVSVNGGPAAEIGTPTISSENPTYTDYEGAPTR